MKNEQVILSQDVSLTFMLKNVNSGCPSSFIRKSDGENIMLMYGILNSIPFRNYRKKLVHYNISIWDISFQLLIRSELIKSFSNASLLGISLPEHRHGFWEIEEDILSYFSLSNQKYGDVNFHMGFIKIPHNNKLMNPIAQNIITNRKIGIISHCKVEKFLLQYNSKVIIRLEIPKRRARFQRMTKTTFNNVKDNIKTYNSQVDIWLVAAGIFAKAFCEYIREIDGIGIDIGSSIDTWLNEYHSRGHLRKLYKEFNI